ncbi:MULTISPECIES: ABC transporter substrate-binding protein [Thermocrispum]|jgi:branched-chain amino acid transport system substrate-binding protein|uniref:ABC transporter substrate-binding protein n=1 Tax=Thermocrispum agreste TaxID=37925 RepID=A0A2W4JKT9_9PSEU|nr:MULTISPECIES: ABC transporter substrate-binding protein [Thermocrispum]PZM98808.1 MAG: ABC transporter substrate-binding protein [Thermocrispum agreste]
MGSAARKRRTLLAGLAVSAVVATAACGGPEAGGSGGGGIEKTIKIAQVQDQTGPIAYAGLGASEGAELAIEEIEQQNFLGEGVKIELQKLDTAGEIERASSEMNKAMGDRDVDAIIGPAATQQAAAVAPLVGRQKVPTVFTQAGGQGVVINDYTFRVTPPMESYYELAVDYLDKKGVKTISVLYNATFPTFAELGEKRVPQMAKDRGIEIVQSLPVQMTTQDFAGQSQQIARKNPDALVMLLIAPQSVTALRQLKDAGYDNLIVATSVQAAGNIKEAGDAANGLVYPVPFSTAMDGESSAAFTEAFRKKFNKDPDPYAADGYDAMWFIARAIKASGDSSREGIRKGLAQVAKEGFTGAMGNLTFEGNDARIEGALVQWQDGKEILAQ